ncbi:ABC transporter ATP-binding protein [Zunongwangia sp. H14]|uniref:ABC transporter ATP-binding protein n=1 Tax=Zunongwangia sp. H14 TaxID=3240792 RepID=UPI003565F324
MELTLSNISKTYPNGVQALKDINLSIPQGMYGMLGPNGAGKSTLMRIIATLQEPDTGSITFGNYNLLQQKGKIRETLGYLPQEFGLYSKSRAEDLLNHFVILKGIIDSSERKKIVENLLKQTNLWDVKRQRVGGFSGGMKQRFGVAIALLGNPKLMIVDEPTAGLDPAERVRFLNLLSEIGENSVVILSTHIVEDVSELCTRMAIINKGEILLEAEPLQAVKNLEGKVWNKIINRDELSEIENKHNVISTKLQSGRSLVQVYSETSPGADFRQKKPGLEDVYFTTMAGHFKNASKTAAQ